MTWYEYRQNNSGGAFTEPAIAVVIQAKSKDDADTIAESVGVDPSVPYCECCGPRWSTVCPYEYSRKPRMDDIFPRADNGYRWADSPLYSKDGVPRVLYVHANGKREVRP